MYSSMKKTVFVILAGLVLSLTSQSVMAQADHMDSSYVLEDTFLVVHMNVPQMLKYEKPDSELRKQLSELTKKQSNFEVENLKSIRFQMTGTVEGDFFGRDGENLFFVRFEFKKAVDGKKVGKSMGSNTEESTYNNVTILESTNEYSPSIGIPDDKTIIIANTPHLKRVLDKPDGHGDMVDMVQKMDKDNDISIAFIHNDTSKKFIEALKKEMAGIPFDIVKIADEAKHGMINVKFSSGKPVWGKIECKDDNGAERIGGAINAMVALGKTMLPAAKTAIKDQPTPDFGDERFKKMMEDQKKMSLETMDYAEQFLEAAKATPDGKVVKIESTVMGGMSGLVKMIANSFVGTMKFATELSSDIEAAPIEIDEAIEIQEADK